MQVPIPENEELRLRRLHASDLLDTECELAFDDVVEMAASICNTPVAAITLLDEHRQWFKAIVGLNVRETSRDTSFCAHTILQEDVLFVEDTARDPRFCDNPFVTGDPHVRFYAGAPVILDDHLAVGSVCVIDFVPRTLTASQMQALRILSRHTAALIKMRSCLKTEAELISQREIARHKLELSEELFQTSIQSMQEGIIVQNADGVIQVCNKQAEQILGLSADQMCGRDSFDPRWHCVSEDFEPLPGDKHPVTMTLTDGLDRSGFVMGVYKPAGDLRWISVNSSLVQLRGSDGANTRSCVCTFVDVTESKQQQFGLSRLAAIVESSQDAIISLSGDGTINSWNNGAEQLYGYSAKEIIGRSVRTLAANNGFEHVASNFVTKIMAGESVAVYESTARAKDDTLIDVSVRLSAIRDITGRVVAVSSVVRDIRDQKLMTERLRRSEELLAVAQEMAGLGCWDIDLMTDAATWSAEMYQITGFSPSSGVPSRQQFLELLAPTDRALFEEQVDRVISTGVSCAAELKLHRHDGTGVWLQWRIKADIRDGKAVRLFGTLLDVTASRQSALEISEINAALKYKMKELQQANQRLANLSTTDGLTGLKNHRAFQERFQEEWKRSARQVSAFSVMMIDVDHFKSYNDSFGHPAGDEVLRKVADIICKTMRTTDFVARYGGEEFVVLLPDTGSAGSNTLAGRLLLAIERADWNRRNITASIGCATSGPGCPDPTSLLALADDAMYRSKMEGRNRVTLSKPYTPDSSPSLDTEITPKRG